MLKDLQSAQGSASRDRLARRSFSVSLNSLVCASVRAISGIFGALLTSHGVVRSIPALGVAPEMMEEISTGVRAHSSPVHAATRAISPATLSKAPPNGR